MWPFSNTVKVIQLYNKDIPANSMRPKALSKSGPSWGPLTLTGLRNMHEGDTFYVLLAFVVWYFTWPCDEDASKLLPRWIMLVLLRNLVIEISLYEFWHQLLFGIFANENVMSCHFHPRNPYQEKGIWNGIWRERFLSCCGFLWSTAYECILIHLWASRTVASCPTHSDLSLSDFTSGVGCQMSGPTLQNISQQPISCLWFLLMFPLMIQFRGVHFFFVHRLMHPWLNRKSKYRKYDFGALLYRYVHKVHHVSYSPGPWSSLSMHPFEHFLYFSGFFVALFIPTHPLHLLFNKYHTDISALPGHDGCGPPGANDVGHYLHHAHYECNYGFSFPNYLDKFFGTYEDGSKYIKRNKSNVEKTATTTSYKKRKNIFKGDKSY